MMLDAVQVRELLRAADYHRVGYPPRAPSGSLALRIRTAVRNAGPEGIRMKDLSRALDKSNAQVASILARLVANGKVTKLARGLYAVCQSESPAESQSA